MPDTPADSQRLDSIEALKVYFDPLRLQILQELSQPSTVHEIADSLGIPFTRLYYHIKMLEKHHIIRVVDTKSMSGAIEEKYYQVSAYQYVVPRHLLSYNDDESFEFVLSTVLDETRADIQQSIQAGLIKLEEQAPHPKSLLLRRGLIRLPEEKASAFYKDLIDLMTRYQAETSTKDDTYYGVAVAFYPTDLPYRETDES